MKKLKLSIFLVVAIISAVLYSCKQDDFSESDAMKLQVQLDKQRAQNQDTLSTSTYRVSYTVTLVDAATSALKSASQTSAISGATVKFIQGDTVIVKTADASGIVAIGNVKPGLANVNITLPNYSEVNYTVNLSTQSINGGREVTNIIPLIPVTGATATITGKVTYDSDLTNKTVEPAPAGTQVSAMVRTNSAALPSTTGGNGIVSISYDKLSLQAVTDANGVYTLTVPSTVNGLTYDIKVSDFSIGQKLLQPTYFDIDTTGILTIPTNFGSSFTVASSIPAANPVVVTVSAPDYTFTPAVANAVVDNSFGIDHINITNNGGSYTQHSGYTLPLNNASIINASTSTGTASFDVNGAGRVTAISVTSSGSNYLPAADNFELIIPFDPTPAVYTVTSIDGSGGITGGNLTNVGRYFMNRATDLVVTTTGSGSNAVLTPSFAGFSGGAYSLNSVTITTAGTGYAVGQTFTISASASLNSNKMKGNLHLTSGFLSAINVTTEGEKYVSGKVDVIIDSPAVIGGTQATATATVTNGKISAIAVSNAGSGYSITNLPKVTIVNKVEKEKKQAKFTAIVSGGKITGFDPASSGSGYVGASTAPITVTIASAIPGQGSGASATASATALGGAVSLTLVDEGSGYIGNNPASAKNLSGSATLTVTGSSTIINNIYLGTGKRTIEQ